MNSHFKRLYILAIVAVFVLTLLPITPVTVAAQEDEQMSRQSVTSIEKQIRAFAKSIDKSNADDDAAWALARHGITGRGKKLSVGQSHALTAMLMNAELSLTTIIRGCEIGIGAMQNKGLSSIFGDAGCYFGKNTRYYYEAALYRKGNADGVGTDVIQVSKLIDFNKAPNAYDTSLVWMTGSTEIHIYITKGDVTADTITYKVKVVFADDFDFNTNDGSVPREIASLLGSILFRKYRWNATAQFSLELPNTCAHSNDFTAKITKPTCTAKGYTTRTCSECGYSYKSDYTNKIDHTYKATVTLPTCTQEGYTTYTCSCKDSYIGNKINATGHNFGKWSQIQAPTCTAAGREGQTCSVCQHTETRIVDWLGHDYSSEWTVDVLPTCTAAGSKSHHCSRCDDKADITTIPAARHVYGVWTKVDDENHNHTCACGDMETEVHTWDDGVITAQPTGTTFGIKTYTCTACFATKTENVDKLTYTVIFKNWNGDVLSSAIYHWGDQVTVPKEPTKAADRTYTYSFAGWDLNVVNCVGDATYTACYQPIFIDYTVTFLNADGTVISKGAYHYGDAVTEPAAPEKPESVGVNYAFTGWDKPVADCNGDITYTAIFVRVLLPGDMNEDDAVNDSDALYLLRHILFADRYPVQRNIDVNADGVIDDADVLYLLRYTLFPNRYPLALGS